MANAELTSAIAAACRSAWLSGQTREFRERVLSNATLVRFSKDERIVRMDEKGSNLYFLLKGSVQVLVPRGDLEVVPAHVLSQLEWFGEYGAFTGLRNAAEYRARAPGAALVLLQSRLRALEGEACFRRASADLLAGSLKRYLELSAGLAGLKGEERVRAKLHALAGAPSPAPTCKHDIVVSQEELAEISGVSRTVVARVLSQLASEGTVATGYRCISVLRREKLLPG